MGEEEREVEVEEFGVNAEEEVEEEEGEPEAESRGVLREREGGTSRDLDGISHSFAVSFLISTPSYSMNSSNEVG